MCSDGDALEQLARALDRLVEVDPVALGTGDVVEELHRQLTPLEAVATRATGALGRSGAWRAGGARSLAAWLGMRRAVPEHVARRRVQVARALPHLPVTEGA